MATFDVFENGKVVQTFEADQFWSKDGEYIFVNGNNDSVGSIVKTPGMSVKKVENSGYGKQYGKQL